jgi:tetratricopeptide (TPR) repeat protein
VEPLGEFRGQALREALDCYNHAKNCDPAWTPARNPLRIPPPDEARLKEAIEHFRQAVRSEPYFALAHGTLGLALLARRELPDAEAEIRRGLELFPAEWDNDWGKKVRANLERQLQRCQRLRALEGRLPAVVQGKDKPAATDFLDLAELCFLRKHYATAARLYAEALVARPELAEDLRAGHRFNAACAAALAGGGQGDDAAGLREPERKGLRKQAREWLRLDLAAWARKVQAGKAGDRVQAQKTLSPWQDDPDLAGLRESDRLERLPPAERQECQALWQEVAALLRRTQTTR